MASDSRNLKSPLRRLRYRRYKCRPTPGGQRRQRRVTDSPKTRKFAIKKIASETNTLHISYVESKKDTEASIVS
jgi:hypothetical protein